jgi:tetratricopeptide (TPR) repeat protein
MIALLDGYVPGLPEDLRAQVLARAQGVPLYAVETVRMLLDRGLVTRDGPVYRPTEEIRTLEIPETLHALAAARLDGLPPEERAVVQQACVLGKTFTKRALARLVGTTEEELDPLLTGLVRKEVLSLQADPRWPERGQYGFLQELLRQVAYETLSRRDRKLRHLAAVTALEATFEGADQEVPEVIAAHLLAAAEASPDDADTPEIRARARAALVQAGDRAAALAAPDEAQRYIDQAAALADDDPVAQAALLEEAGRLAVRGGRIDDARDRLERAIAQFEALGERQAATRAGVALADVAIFGGRIDEAVGRFESAVEALEADGLSEELATTLASLGRLYALRGDTSTAAPLLERTLTLAEALRLDELFVQALTSKGVVLIGESRLQEARLLLEAAVERAEAGSYAQSWTRAMNNLGAVLESSDELYAMVSVAARSWEFAQRRGDRESAATARYGVLRALFEIGEWDDVAQRVEEAQDAQASPWSIGGIVDAVPMYCERGDLETATEIVNRESWQRSAEQTEVAAAFASAEARLLRAQGLPQKALEVATRAVRQRGEVPFAYASIRGCLMEALEAALQLGDPAAVAELLEIIDALRPGEVSPLLGGHRSRVDALARAASGDEDGVESSFRSAEATFHTAGAVFRRAVTLVEHGEWLAGHGRSDEAAPLLDDARVTFVRLAAEPWLDRIDAVTAPTAAAAD